MANIKVIGALLIVLSIDLFLLFGQTATAAIAAEDPTFNGNTFLQGNTTWFGGNGENITLPAQGSVAATDGALTFTDSITVSKSWISTAGSYFVKLISGPVNYLVAIGLPKGFTDAIAALWYILTIFLIVAWILGKE